MSVLLLVRHGQASFGSADYDVLSGLGERQSGLLGQSLAARGVRPDVLVSGTMRRHRSTLRHAVDAAGWTAPVTLEEGWNEFDHEQLVEVHEPAYRSREAMNTDLARTPDPRGAFQEVFVAAVERWVSGDRDHEYTESFTAFGQRVEHALHRTIEALEPRQTAVVFTSGGPIAWAAASLLGGGADLWSRLNVVSVNTGVSKVVVGRSGRTLVSLNDHGHLESGESGLLTYR